MDNIINHLKSINYVSINITSKIQTHKDVLEIISKALNPKYKKVVFYIYLKNINEYFKKEFKYRFGIEMYQNEDVVIMINKNNYHHHPVNCEMNICNVNKFLAIEKKMIYECNVCLEDTFTSIHTCPKCTFQICEKCHKKLIMEKLMTLDGGDVNIECCCCKTILGSVKCLKKIS